jgi:protein-S-isoprenylcysteine O-methyltransferase Ste14
MGERERVSIIPPPRLMSVADLQRLQQKRKSILATGVVVGVLLMAFTDSVWRVGWPRIHGTIQWSGLILVLICILGRTWTALYIGGQKRRMLVTKGPYSVVRNPLYLFTLLGSAGIGALSGSLTYMAVCSAFAAAVFLSVVRREEQFLLATFPHEYLAYTARVPRLLPRFSTWQDADYLDVKPRLVHRTFFEASLFLMAVPLIALKALARDLEWLPILLRLP